MSEQSRTEAKEWFRIQVTKPDGGIIVKIVPAFEEPLSRIAVVVPEMAPDDFIEIWSYPSEELARKGGTTGNSDL